MFWIAQDEFHNYRNKNVYSSVPVTTIFCEFFPIPYQGKKVGVK